MDSQLLHVRFIARSLVLFSHKVAIYRNYSTSELEGRVRQRSVRDMRTQVPQIWYSVIKKLFVTSCLGD